MSEFGLVAVAPWTTQYDLRHINSAPRILLHRQITLFGLVSENIPHGK